MIFTLKHCLVFKCKIFGSKYHDTFLSVSWASSSETIKKAFHLSHDHLLHHYHWRYHHTIGANLAVDNLTNANSIIIYGPCQLDHTQIASTNMRFYCEMKLSVVRGEHNAAWQDLWLVRGAFSWALIGCHWQPNDVC